MFAILNISEYPKASLNFGAVRAKRSYTVKVASAPDSPYAEEIQIAEARER
jgi:hypothetical protein